MKKTEVVEEVQHNADSVNKKRKVDGSNSNRRSKKRKACFDFLRTSTCKYGNECKFAHVEQDKERVNLANREKIMSMNSKNSSYVARTFWQLYYPTDKGNSHNNSNDRYIFLHPNDIAMVGLAETHPIFKSERIEIRFSNHNLNDKIIRKVVTSGKSKNGGIKCTQGDMFCTIVDLNDDNKEYHISSPLNGLLIEVNTRLLKEPNLLLTHPHSLGYLCIFQAQKRKKFSFSGCMEKEQFAEFKNLELDDGIIVNSSDTIQFKTLFKQNNFTRKC
jgi:glycine cleavage system H lipoate-binding protein